MADAEARVRVVAPDGEVGTIPESYLSEALRDGFKPLNEQQKAQQEIGPVGSAAMGVFAGATMGLGPQAVDYVGEQLGVLEEGESGAVETLRTARTAHPTVTAVSEGLGQAGSLALSGGSGLALKGGAKLSAAFLGKAANTAISKTAQSAVKYGAAGFAEGAVMGTANLVTEESLGDAEFNAEGILNHVAPAAVLGGGFGLGMGALAPALAGGTKATKNVVKKQLKDRFKKAAQQADEAEDLAASAAADDISDALRGGAEEAGTAVDKVADGLVQESLGLTGATWARLTRRMGEKRVRGAMQRLRKLEVDTPEGPQRVVGRGDSAGDISAKLSQHIEKQGAVLGKHYRGLDALSPDGAIDAAKVVDDMEGLIKSGLDKFADPVNRNAIEAVDVFVEHVKRRAKDGKLTFQASQELRTELGAAYRTVSEAEGKRIRRQFERVLKKYSDEAMESVPDDALGAGWKVSARQANDDLALLINITDASETQAIKNAARSHFGLTDTIMGGAVTAGRLAQGGSLFEAGLQGAIVGTVARQVKDRGASFLARLADDFAESPAANAAVERIAGFSAIETAANASAVAIDKAVKAFASGSRYVPKAAASAPQFIRTVSFEPGSKRTKDPQESAKRIAKELEHLTEDPQVIADRVAASLGKMTPEAPTHASAMVMKTQQMVQFLHQRAPKPPQSVSRVLTPRVDNWKPSKSASTKFARYVRAASRPVSVVEDLAKGQLTPEAAEVLRELYPKMFEYTQARIMEQIADRTKPMPYKQRVSLSVLFGQPFDDTMVPRFLQTIQSQFKGQPQQGQGGGGVRLSSLEKLEPSKGMSSRSSEIAGDAGE